MDIRHQEITRLKAYTDGIEKEVTLLLQNLQWDPKFITKKHPMVTCKCDSNHRIPLEGRDIHEKQCHLTKLGYRKDDIFLPDPVDPDADTLVKFSKNEIADIINNAAIDKPYFKRGVGWQESEPLTVERLQRVYSADERCAIHDAVVNSAPFCHDLTGLDLLSSNNDPKESRRKSRLEILAELRNMKRRRTKYRVAPKTRNYSDVLRDVIKTQMDTYGEATRTIIKTEYGQNVYVSQNISNTNLENVTPCSVPIKLERESPEPHSHNTYQRDHRDRHRSRSREKRYNDDKRVYSKHDSPSKERDRRYNVSHESKVTEKRRETKNDNDVRRHHTDKYSSKERRTHDYNQKEHDNKNKSQEHTYNDNRSRYHSGSSRVKNYESYKKYNKNEYGTQESESYSDNASDRDHDRSRSRDITFHGDHDYKHSKRERSGKHKRYILDNTIKQERISPPGGSYSNDETSRIRHRSRSKERRQDKANKSRDKEYERRKRKSEFSPGRAIKQERQSP